MPFTPAYIFALSLLLALSLASAQQSGDERMKRPLNESDLRKVESLGEPPRAIAVTPETRKAVAVTTAPNPAPEPAAEPAKKGKGPTEITALEATFDNKTHLAVFLHDVTVKDPEFNVTCEKLTAFLKHPDDKPEVSAPVPAPIKSAPDPQQKKGGLERAIAEGSVVITQEKTEADGTLTHYLGTSKKADYDARTGDIVLTGRPTVKQGINLCVATAEETVMTLNRDRNMKVVGPHRTIIADKGDMDKKP